MGTAVRPAKTSPGPWDAFADVDVFVDEVLAELEAMIKVPTTEQQKRGALRAAPPRLLLLSVISTSRESVTAL
jgi:hypothetical protein